MTIDRLTAALADRYLIEGELGAGGMATVYLARDLKHDRQVALKVLKPELAAVLGAERFVVEIKTTAALQHPHILPLFDSGTADGFLYYVMPYIQGETLRAKLDRETQLGIDEAVKIASDVADALHCAHQQGVIHRDIKPENILLANGRPMVADFGIALAVSAAAGGRMTETGLSLGTPHYMSPEQATAEKEITARSDIYSLGSVLYEMLTGNPPHTGASAQQIIMQIVTEEAVPVTRLRKAVPPNVAAAVAKSLEKLPADRFESAAKFAEALSNPAFRVEGQTAALTGARGSAVSRRAFTGVAALAVLAGAVALWGWLRPTAAPAATPTRFQLSLFTSVPQWRHAALSPDGSSIAFPQERGAGRLIWLKTAEQAVAEPLAGTEGGMAPTFSPDGEWIAFVGVSMALSDNGTLLYSPAFGSDDAQPVWITRDGKVSPVDSSWSFDPGTGGPVLSPDGRRLAVAIQDGAATTIWLKDLAPGGGLMRLTFDGVATTPQWTVDGGSLLYTHIFAGTGQWDVRRRRVDGADSGRTVLRSRRDIASFALLRDTTRLIVRFGPPQTRDIYLARRGAMAEDTLVPLFASDQFEEVAMSLSPDERWLAYTSNESGRFEVYVVPFPDVKSARWQVSAAGGRSPRWARSGRELFFRDLADGVIAVPVKSGSSPVFGERRLLFRLEGMRLDPVQVQFDVSPDDRRFLFLRNLARESEQARIVLVQNWLSEVRERMRGAR